MPDWSLCWTHSRPWALCLVPLLYNTLYLLGAALWHNTKQENAHVTCLSSSERYKKPNNNGKCSLETQQHKKTTQELHFPYFWPLSVGSSYHSSQALLSSNRREIINEDQQWPWYLKMKYLYNGNNKQSLIMFNIMILWIMNHTAVISVLSSAHH